MKILLLIEALLFVYIVYRLNFIKEAGTERIIKYYNSWISIVDTVLEILAMVIALILIVRILIYVL